MDITIQDIFNKFGNIYNDKYVTSYNRLNTYNNIKTCRTKEQGVMYG